MEVKYISFPFAVQFGLFQNIAAFFQNFGGKQKLNEGVNALFHAGANFVLEAGAKEMQYQI